MKVLLLSRYSQTGASSRLRFYQYLPYLTAAGIEVTVNPCLDDQYILSLYSGQKIQKLKVLNAYLKRLKSFLKYNSYDLIWIEKELLPWLPAFAEVFLRYLGISYLVDYDDAVFHRYDQHHNPLIRAFLGRKIDKIMGNASMVIVGNNYLAERARAAGAKRIEYLPTVINLDHYRILQPQKKNIFTIGWIGTPVTAKYLNGIARALAEVATKRSVRMVVVGTEKPALEGIYIEALPWSEKTEVEQISRFDVGIMPLFDDFFERGKCGYKLIQYMACGIPGIASPVGVNQEIVEQGYNGFLAATHEQWVDALITLVDNKELAQQMGRAGRCKVEKEYCLQVTAPRLVEFIHQASHRTP